MIIFYVTFVLFKLLLYFLLMFVFGLLSSYAPVESIPLKMRFCFVSNIADAKFVLEVFRSNH